MRVINFLRKVFYNFKVEYKKTKLFNEYHLQIPHLNKDFLEELINCDDFDYIYQEKNNFIIGVKGVD